MQRLLALAAVLLSGMARAATPDAVFAREFGDDFLDRYWAHNTDAAVGAGYYKYADRLVVPDAAARKRYLEFLDASLRKLSAIDATRLDASHRTDWSVLKGRLDAERWYLTVYRDWEWNPSGYNVADAFSKLSSTPYAPAEERLRAMSRRLANVPAYYAAGKAAVKHPVREYTQLAIEQNTGGLDVFGSDFEALVASATLAAGERARLLHRAAAARAAIADYVGFLKRVDAGQGASTKSFRIGPKLYEQKFALDIQSGESAAHLYERAVAEKEKLHARMSELADELWPKYLAAVPKPADRLESIRAAIDRIAESHVAPDQFVPSVKALVPRLEKWVSDHQLLTLDSTRPLEVREMPPYQRGFSMANLQSSGPYDPAAQSWYNVSPLDAYTAAEAESFLREYNGYTMQILSIHEGVPGHYVQLMYANKSPSRIKAVFGNGATVEGWAVYSERMMMESGWGDNAPEMWLMYYKWYLRAVCNAILDFRLHTQGLTEQGAMDLLRREAFQSETEATGKWRRARLSAVQLATYFSGYAAVYDFREQLKKEQGASFDLKRFHEQFLSYGSAPVGMIKELMHPQ
ncbi:MAG: DUF885 domain-containing protein [Casimicrobiaceae bacterium]